MLSRALSAATVRGLGCSAHTTTRRLAPAAATRSAHVLLCRPAAWPCAYGQQQQQQARLYASKKGGKKSGKKSGGSGGRQPADEQADQDDAPPVDMDRMEKHMVARVERFTSELQALRAGRASPAILDHVRVQLQAESAPLSELALVTVRDAQNLLVIPNNPDEQREIEAAIRNADLGLNPRVDKNALVVPVPKATKESREKLVKGLGAAAEQTRVHIRKVRQDAMKHLKHASKEGMAKDEVKSWEKDIQKATDGHIARVEELLKAKTREIERA